MNQSNYLTVSQVVDQLKSNYQKVLYMIKTNKLPAKKEGRSFKIPANYLELMAERADKTGPKRKQAAKKGKRVLLKEKPIVAEKVDLAATRDRLINNLVQAIQELVEFQVTEALARQPKRRNRK